MNDSNCPVARACFLRSTAFAALGGIVGAGLLADPAFAQSVGSVTPTRSNGRTLTYALPAREGALIDAGNGVILARVNKTVYALSIICPHRATTTLEWLPDSREFHCPKHDAHFQPDGQLIDGRPDRAMDRYAVHRAGQSVVVDTSTVFQQDASQDAWSRATVTVA
ncbi:MAG TPA: Rieske (2Fe-2S) protein [Candidatus Elarobacter sp.]|jgi:nitrite reductase/ring-hydroxylating ferredoxin subunit|nr:Rieske (2Fe-2S) protein [Candidatus Elarobacter sp.]